MKMSPVAVLSMVDPSVEDQQMIQIPKGSRCDIPEAILLKLFFADEPPLLVEIMGGMSLRNLLDCFALGEWSESKSPQSISGHSRKSL